MTSKLSTDWQKLIKSGDRIFIGSNAAVPNVLIQDLIDNAGPLRDIEVVHILTMGKNAWVNKKYRDLFRVNSLFLGPGTRRAVAGGYADYTPCFLSEIPGLFKDQILPLDAALVSVSPPDKHGYCSLGVSVDVVSSACRYARQIIAQINPKMPATNGHSFIHMSQIDAWMEAEEPLFELEDPEIDRVTEQIGQYVSMLIEDGATLQLGIGKIPNAVLHYLSNHKDLGVHSEMFSDGIIELINSGVINNRRKTFHRGKTITTFCLGTQRLYDFVHQNPHVEFYPSEHVNNPANIAKNDRMVSINGAIEVDLTGQVVADSLGFRFYSGIGGQVDFIRGAAMSKGGRPIIALPSTSKNGTVYKIVPFVTQGSGVATSRGDVHYMVTEYGIATLRGKSIRERALELIQVAHPKFRDELLREVRKHYWVPDYQLQKPTDVPEWGNMEVRKLKLKDGERYNLRPLQPSDERLLQEFFYSHTKETLLMRYSHHPKQMSREKASALVAVDQAKDLALCITQSKGPREEIEAIGRFYYLEQSNAAEVAFVVREALRGRGLARRLLKEIIAIGRQRGLSKLTASVRADNKPMLRVFAKNGFVRMPVSDMQEVVLELALDEE
ncbi:GNAT family N-acetyltransferase [Candidatus Vondammii sp. HM_W22]|uniref:GNAT family N-acetyltransferase n=1 Tax=Candidatus Vondammii sp. HM_W22 TaxID=2687299 RepID=UPI001F145471|nr:GNAT family N-acetyltransferase [Candidatus Vondammii sp. HM_W22]